MVMDIGNTLMSSLSKKLQVRKGGFGVWVWGFTVGGAL